jgi:hypothetical protein
MFATTMPTAAAATMAIKNPKSKSRPFHGSFIHWCMGFWKKPETWPLIEDLDNKFPWSVYLQQKVAHHAESKDVWLGIL